MRNIIFVLLLFPLRKMNGGKYVLVMLNCTVVSIWTKKLVNSHIVCFVLGRDLPWTFLFGTQVKT